jgi:hypothetical protein
MLSGNWLFVTPSNLQQNVGSVAFGSVHEPILKDICNAHARVIADVMLHLLRINCGPRLTPALRVRLRENQLIATLLVPRQNPRRRHCPKSLELQDG